MSILEVYIPRLVGWQRGVCLRASESLELLAAHVHVLICTLRITRLPVEVDGWTLPFDILTDDGSPLCHHVIVDGLDAGLDVLVIGQM